MYLECFFVFALFLGLSLCVAGKVTDKRSPVGFWFMVAGTCITSAWLITFTWCQLFY